MIIINTPDAMVRALASPLDPLLDRLLRLRVEWLTGYEGYAPTDLATFAIIEPTDKLAEIEAALFITLTVNSIDGSRWPEPDFTPLWERCEDHGGLFEITIILDDSGYGYVLFVPDHDAIDPNLLSLCRAFADARSCN